MLKGHEFIKVEEREDSITWQCSKCGRLLSFSKIYEPKTEGELPENAGDYVDPCEVS